jgi:hypothetical protein
VDHFGPFLFLLLNLNESFFSSDINLHFGSFIHGQVLTTFSIDLSLNQQFLQMLTKPLLEYNQSDLLLETLQTPQKLLEGFNVILLSKADRPFHFQITYYHYK